MAELVDTSLLSQARNPELNVDPRKSNAVVDAQVSQLKLVTSRLGKAYSGSFVDWIDTGHYYTPIIIRQQSKLKFLASRR